MSSGKRPEYFFDRSLGRRSAAGLIASGWTIHLIADHYPSDAESIPDQEWMAEGCRRDWVLLTKDQRIRYRADELAALQGQLFCLSSGNLTFDQMTARFLAAAPAIERVVEREETGFWLVYENGRVAKKWP